MANIKVQYNGSTANYTAPLDTAGKLMASNLTITSEPVLQDKSVTSNGSITADSGYDGLGTVNVAVPSDLNNTDLDVTQTFQVQNYQAPVGYSGIGSITVTAQTANPAFKGGILSVDNVDISANGTNATVSDETNTSGISLSIGAEFEISRGSILYNGNVNGWVNKTNNTVALSSDASQEQSDIKTVYINSVTVPSGKTLTVVNNGTTNINGGNANRGVRVAGKVATVDTYVVTDANGDLLVPTYTASSKALSYPTTWTTAGSTATYLPITGDVETINGLTIKDSTALKGSGTAPTDATYGYYLAKWNTASSLGTGSKVTISTSTPSGGANGDIWYQVL